MSQLFEDFSAGPIPYQDDGSPAQDALDSFDKGYKAGWDDASKAHEDSQSKASSVLARNLETLDFSIVEARGMILQSIGPVLAQIGQVLLPGMAQDALRAQFTTQLNDMLSQALPDKIVVEVSAEDHRAIMTLLEAANAAGSVSVSIRDTLGAGQIYMRCEDAAKRIDVPAALQDIEQSLSDFEAQATQQEPEQTYVG